MFGFLLADVEALGGGGREVKQVRTGEMVVEDRVGLLEKAFGFEGDEFRIAWSRADQINLDLLHYAASLIRTVEDACAPRFSSTWATLRPSSAGLRAFAGRGVADHRAAVGREDRAGEKEFGVFERAKSADRNLAAAAEFGQHGALGGDGQARPRIVQRRAGIIARAFFERLDSERALAHRGAHDVGTEDFADDVAPAEAAKAGGGEHDGVILAALDFVDAGVDVAADRLNVEVAAGCV